MEDINFLRNGFLFIANMQLNVMCNESVNRIASNKVTVPVNKDSEGHLNFNIIKQETTIIN